MKTRNYDRIDLDLIFEAPCRWSDFHASKWGQCCNWLRQDLASATAEPGYRTNMEIHTLMMFAHKAYVSAPMPSPWNDEWERYPEQETESTGGPLVGNTVKQKLLCYYIRNGRSARSVAMDAVVALGHKLKTVNAEMDLMHTEGLLDRKDRGVYDVSPKGKNVWRDVLKTLAAIEAV